LIIPDVNLLLHAHNRDSPWHGPARKWWKRLLESSEVVGLPWVAMLGFIRITTNRHVLEAPLSVEAACATVREWLAQPYVGIVHPGERHAEVLFRLIERLGTGGNLTTDAHLAALAVEHQAELHSTDRDFGRFPGLRFVNPLA
jgi:toxin-antitoxin system PIN domain toxin